MLINIAIPKRYSYKKMLKNSNAYFGEKRETIFFDKNQKYYIFLNQYGLDINIVNCDDKVKKEINHYLEFLFKDQYIGISKGQDNNLIQLEKVKLYEV